MDEAWISVDIEASGPTPGTGSMIAIGACLVDQPEVQFEATLAPIPGLPWSPEAERVHGLTREYLATAGTSPESAMRSFVDWVVTVAAGRRPVFVGFNATFDWMFVTYYLVHFTGESPFGISGLDIKAYYMGALGKRSWRDTAKGNMDPRFLSDAPHTHHALDDAREQAEVFQKVRAYVEARDAE